MLILCCGNPDRGDDAAGPLVAARLNARVVAPLDLLEAWAGAPDVIVVDAVVSGAPPGTVTVWEAGQLSAIPSRGGTHSLGLAEAVGLAQALGKLPERLRIYGIEARSFAGGAPPSPEVLAAVERVVQEIACMSPR